MRRMLQRGIGIAALVSLSACGAGGGVTATRSQTTTPVEATEPTTPSTDAPETVATSTAAPSTDAPTTTQETTTTMPAAAGWQDVATMPNEAFPPCCASNFYGTPSPPLPATGEMPDGLFFARRVTFSPGEPSTMVIDVLRFEQCVLLPEGSCEPLPEGYEYQPDELGVAGDPRTFTVPLDGTVKVTVAGWDTDPVLREATGTELAALLIELNAAYQEVIAAPLAAGTDADAIVDGLLASPVRGFGPPAVEMYGTLMYTFDGAPPVLMQAPFEYPDSGERLAIDPTTVVYLTSVEFSHGLMTLYFYAGYYP